MKKKIIIPILLLLILLITGICISYSLNNKEYYCDDGTLVDDKCQRLSQVESSYVCEDGDLTDDNKCKIVTMVIDAKKGVSQVCKSGYSIYTDNGIDMCISQKTYPKSSKETSCPESDDKNVTIEEVNGQCQKTTCTKKDDSGKCTESTVEIVDHEIEMSCPDGTRYIYGACRKYSYRTPKYSCEIGELKDSKCYIYDEVDATLSCPDGYTLNEETSICEKTYYTDALTK